MPNTKLNATKYQTGFDFEALWAQNCGKEKNQFEGLCWNTRTKTKLNIQLQANTQAKTSKNEWVFSWKKNKSCYISRAKRNSTGNSSSAQDGEGELVADGRNWVD